MNLLYVHYSPGELMVDKISAYLRHVQETFADVLAPLDSVSFNNWIDKIHAFADAVLCVDENGVWKGACFGYCNDIVKRRAFITSISKNDREMYQGVGRGLLNAFCSIVREKMGGAAALELEVYKGNLNAREFYRKMGFEIFHETDSSLYMRKIV